MTHRMFLIALLLVALPLAADTPPGSRSFRVTLAVHAGPDSAAVARRLAAMYRGELETPVDADGTFLIALTDAAAEVLAADAGVQSVAAATAPTVTTAAVRTPQIVANGSTSWPLGAYSYDGTGNIRKIGSDTYVYDSTTRLVSGVAGGKTEQYTYDEFGNILTIETSGSARQVLGVHAASNRMDQATGTVAGQSAPATMTAGYDANGNVTSYNLDRFQYDGLNVLRKAHVAAKWRSYVYNASDERIAVIEQSSEFGGETRSDWTLRDASGQVLRRLSREAGQWQWNQDYVYRDGQMLASEVAGPAKRYQYHLDHLGTPRLITGNGGVEVSRHTYLPFGAEVGAVAGQNPQDGEWKKFTGHERDQGSIDYMHARYYNPFMGRFLSVDPAPGSAKLGLPQTWNRYSYARNNTLKHNDPDGRETNPVTGQSNIYDHQILNSKNNPQKGHYGYVRNSGTKWHSGNDIAAPRGTPIFAPISGTVSTGYSKEGGHWLRITKKEGKDTIAIHMSHLNGPPNVKDGAKVLEGQPNVGQVGNTGNAANEPPHVHTSVYVNGNDKIKDTKHPQDWFRDHPAENEWEAQRKRDAVPCQSGNEACGKGSQ